jgi:hypothetical protein
VDRTGSTSSSDAARPKVVYHVESHTLPDQLERLVRRLLDADPDTFVVVDHDSRSNDDLGALATLPRVQLNRSPGGYADFSHVRRYLKTLDWLERSGIDYDWITNLSGQDYPIRDLRAAQSEWAAGGVDGYLEWFPAFDPASPWGSRLGRSRYTFSYRRLRALSPRARSAIRPAMAINYLQPWFRLNVATGLAVGRRRSSPFDADLVCYGGSLFCTLSRAAAEYVLNNSRQNPGLVSYYERCLSPAESYLQTVLINSGQFSFASGCRRYFDFSHTRNNHPKTLSTEDLPALLESNADFGRKFDGRLDSDVLDQLDEAADATRPTSV